MYTKAGEYAYTKDYPAPYECVDTLFRIRVIRYDSISEKVCAGESYEWREQTLSEDKIYRDTLRMTSEFTGEPVDTAYYVLNLSHYTAQVDSTEEATVNVTNLPYLWRGQECNETKEYTDTIKHAGTQCVDTVYHLNLTVIYEPTKYYLLDTLCLGDTLVWGTEKLTTSTKDTLVRKDALGNDTAIYYLDLTVLEPTVLPVKDTLLMKGDTIIWNDSIITTAAELADTTYYETYGCVDTISRLHVVLVDSTATIACYGDTLDWRNMKLYTDSIYRDTVRAASIFADGEVDKEYYILSFSHYKAQVDSMLIDSVKSTELPYLWRGKEYNTDKTDADTVYHVGTQCIDTVYHLDLTVIYEVKEYNVFDTLCLGDTLVWGTEILTTSTKDTLVMQDALGHDTAIYYLDLTVLEPHVLPVVDTLLMKGDTIIWNDSIITTAAELADTTYYETYGCVDTISRLHVVLVDSAATIACYGDTLDWRGMKLYTDSIYRDTVRTASIFADTVTIDKEYYILNLSHYKAPVDSTLTDTVKATELPYLWREKEYRLGGIYTDTIYHADSLCIDSLYHLDLTVDYVVDKRDLRDTLCSGDTLVWGCERYAHDTILYDTLRYVTGQDSVCYTMYLTVLEPHVLPVVDTVLIKGVRDTIIWLDSAYTAATEVADTTYYPEPYGCLDTISRLRIVLYDSASAFSCNGDTMDWRNMKLYQDSIYRDMVRTISMFTGEEINLEYHILNYRHFGVPVDSIDSVYVSSENLPYLWRTMSLDSTDTYRDTVWYADSLCIDSLFTLNLFVEPLKDSVRYDTICHRDTVLWFGNKLTESGTYPDTIRYASGNDSLRAILFLTVRMDSIAPVDSTVLCNNESIEWYDSIITESGTYYHWTHYPLTEAQKDSGMEVGCDSVLHTLYVKAYHVDSVALTDSVCEQTIKDNNYKYAWNGKTWDIPETDLYTKSYTLLDTVRYDSIGCDSMRYKMDVTVLRAERRLDLDTTICEQDVINFRWKPFNTEYAGFTETTTKYDTARFVATGCDSVIYQLNLRVLKPLRDTIDVDTTICSSDVVEWYGQIYNQEGSYPHTVKYAATGCDSAYYRLNLKFFVTPDTVTEAQPWKFCQGAPISVTWRGHTITSDTSRTYWDSTFYSGTQCIEHYYKLDVEILTTEIIDTTAVICEGSSIIWDRTGEEVSDTAQVYEKILPYRTLAGCDSVIYRLHLVAITPEIKESETRYICKGESYTWPINNVKYTETGTYMDTVRSVGGCDSIIYTLKLEAQAAQQTQYDTLYICGSGQVRWSFNNKVYAHAGIYLDTIYTEQGCPLIAGELLVDEHEVTNADPEDVSIYKNDPGYLWHGTTYTEEGTYTYIDTYRASGCDSIIYTLNLTLLDRTMVVEDVEDVVCSGTDYLHDGKHIINGHTEWSDTIISYQPGTDKVTNYKIDIYQLTFPTNFMAGVTVACHNPVVISDAKSVLENYLDTTTYYAPITSVDWYISENYGEWQTLDTMYEISGNDTIVGVKVIITTECGTIIKDSTYKVGEFVSPDTYTEYDMLPVIKKYNGLMLMVDVDAICQKFGWTNHNDEISTTTANFDPNGLYPDQVQWYKQIGEIDDLSHPIAGDPADQPMNKYGYYYKPADDDSYYAFIKRDLVVQVGDCGVWARTISVTGESGVDLLPNVAHINEQVTITNVTSCFLTITDINGATIITSDIQQAHAPITTGKFHAPNAQGTYFVVIETTSGTYHRTLLVYP